MIKSGKFKELHTQVFNQTLGGDSTYTDVMDEREELALVEAICIGSSGVAKQLAMQYWQHYAPFNSAMRLMIEHIKYPFMPDVLMPIIKKWGPIPEQTKLICKAVCDSGGEQYLPLAEACAQYSRALSKNPEMVYWFEKLDDQYGCGLKKTYESHFGETKEKPVEN